MKLAPPECGNNICSPPEDCQSCPKDCTCCPSSSPYLCADSSCASLPTGCPVLQCTGVRCWNGGCAASSPSCPNLTLSCNSGGVNQKICYYGTDCFPFGAICPPCNPSVYFCYDSQQCAQNNTGCCGNYAVPVSIDIIILYCPFTTFCFPV
jgi:hypothetical protein